VDLDSADVWSHPQWFQLRPDGWPKVVAGVPPDFFSKDGQLWGNPLYNWNAMRRDRFGWWIRRIRHLPQYVDVVRIDHFRGLQACWEVSAASRTAKKGHWVTSPGAEILTRLRDELGGHLPLVAEDLGTITPEVEQLRDDFALPGMRILQFGFGDNPSSTMLPHHYPRNVIVYTGTHDNDTTLSWYRHLPARTRAYFHRYASGASADPVGAMIHLAMASVADLAIIPLQDLLRLGREARMNTPGTMTGNWSWRMRPAHLHPSTFTEFRDLARTFGRTR
jgi:4-alpha-glucanotransferase